MPEPQPTSVSVVICTRNRSASLSRTLQSLRGLDLSLPSGLELLVIDNASTDDTRETVLEFSREAPFKVAYFFEELRGLSHARNRGLKEASGDLIMFTDDDCLVDADWVKNAVLFFGGDLLKLVGGRVDLHNPDHLTLSTKPSPFPETLSSPGSLLGFLHGANMAFGREVARRIGLFDVRFGAGSTLQSAEDVEYVYRASTHGIPVMYEPSIRVRHDHGRSEAKEEYVIRRGYSVGAGAMLMKYILNGDFKLFKPVYWDARSSLRDWWTDRRLWRPPLSKVGLAIGAARFLMHARSRNAE